MTTASGFAVLVSLFVLWFLYQQEGACVRCSGRGRHRRGCPFAEHDDES